MPAIDITGKRFGRLTAIEQRGRDAKWRAKWFCVCDCGQTVVTHSRSLRTGLTRSCGCLREEHARAMGQANRRR